MKNILWLFVNEQNKVKFTPITIVGKVDVRPSKNVTDSLRAPGDPEGLDGNKMCNRVKHYNSHFILVILDPRALLGLQGDS